MYLFENIPKDKYPEVLIAVKNRNWGWLKRLCDKHDVIPEGCDGCKGLQRVEFWDWFDWAVSEKMFSEKN